MTLRCNYCGYEAPVVEGEVKGGIVTPHDAALITEFGPYRPMFSSCPKCRDEFAMAAPLTIEGAETFEQNAIRRYRWADAMMSARQARV